MKKIVYYVNQFYGQIGGEEAADQTPIVKEGSVGPAVVMQEALKDIGEVVATIVCGDNYFADHQDEALEEILKVVEEKTPDLFVAGPGFNAGRYGLACGTICDAVAAKYKIPVLTGLYPENPGAEMFHKTVYIVEPPISAAGMRKVIPVMVKLARKMLTGEEIGFPEEEGYIPRGFRVNVHTEKTGAVRAVDMMIAKHAKIALVTSGGIVPKGNPDHIASANPDKFGIYDIAELTDLTGDKFMTVHGGYDPVYATEDPDRVVPLDALRAIEKEGGIGEVFGKLYSTVGNTTAVSSAKKFAEEIAADMKKNEVSAAILTSN